jgi:hypothetical protein
LDASNNSALEQLSCSFNTLRSLDVSNNSAPIELDCYFNPDLYCIQVADSTQAANNFYWQKDSTAHYSENCNYTGVEDNLIRNKSVSVYPNPAQDYIELSYPPLERGSVGVAQFRIYNILGIEFTTPSLRDTPPCQGGEIIRLDISQLAPGVYFVRVGDKVQKFIKY